MDDAMKDYLKTVFYDQAATWISPSIGPDVTIRASSLTAALPIVEGMPVFKSTKELRKALYLALPESNQSTGIAAFYVPSLDAETYASAFGIQSRGIMISPSVAYNFWALAHELGHCFGLHHTPHIKNPAGLAKIADRLGPRLMSYSESTTLRYFEARVVNAWRVEKTNPPSHDDF